jgi:NAD(P)-dependent dehydrogenase (short-subunit alcohol dehydrogenase family)
LRNRWSPGLHREEGSKDSANNHNGDTEQALKLAEHRADGIQSHSNIVLPSGLHPVPHLVVITGGNVGLGYEAARDLAKRGAKVVIGCRNEEAGKQAEEEIRREVLKEIHNLGGDSNRGSVGGTGDNGDSDLSSPSGDMIVSLPLDLTSAHSIRHFASRVAEMRNNMRDNTIQMRTKLQGNIDNPSPRGNSNSGSSHFDTELTLVCNAGVWLPPQKQASLRHAKEASKNDHDALTNTPAPVTLSNAAKNTSTSNIVNKLEAHFTTNHLGHFLLVRELLGEELFRDSGKIQKL